jgi:glycerol-3-phosphate O-acyltransferase
LLYGAGINLFSNPITSFFMHNLGAYRVDRKKQSLLYKAVLKEYTTFALEMGYHQLFFPGGTRSRSGAVEQHLKKGLLGTLTQAFVNNLNANKANPKFFIVPCTLSYKLVLEAEALIKNYLAETGKASYIIEDDEFSKPRRVLNFLTSIISLNDDITVTFSPALDLVGNRVDEHGHSLDKRGRIVDTLSFVSRDGEAYHDEQRNHEYTNEAALAIAERYLQDNVVMSTHLVSRAIFRMLQQRNPELDLYRLLRTGGDAPSFGLSDVCAEVERLLALLKRNQPAAAGYQRN